MDIQALLFEKDSIYQTILKASDAIKSKIELKRMALPKIGIICGSGLSHIANIINHNALIIPYSEIPGLPNSDIDGHINSIAVGRANEKPVICFQGRYHFYEGFPTWVVTMPIRIMKLLGVEVVFITNVTGGININYNLGDIMILKDHINMTGRDPLIGLNDLRWGPRFPDLSDSYDPELIKLCRASFIKLGLESVLREGVYFMLTGPCYETKAESNVIRILGGDVVGASTVPEVIAARHCGLKVCSLSLVTAVAQPTDAQALITHEEVLRVANDGAQRMSAIIMDVISSL